MGAGAFCGQLQQLAGFRCGTNMLLPKAARKRVLDRNLCLHPQPHAMRSQPCESTDPIKIVVQAFELGGFLVGYSLGGGSRAGLTGNIVVREGLARGMGYESWLDAGAVAEDNCKPTGYNAGLSVAGTIPRF